MNFKDNSEKDKLYSNITHEVENFTFNEQVAEVFSDMINRSVPGYQHILNGISLIANKFAKSNSNIYDLGCSLGSVTRSVRHILENSSLNNINFIAVDNSQAMIDRSKLILQAYNSRFNTVVELSDVTNTKISNASVVILNFLLQFISVEQRYKLLTNIYNGMQVGGVLVLSEKIKYQDNDIDSLIVDLHHDFKKQNGYSELEIKKKRDALEKVMLIDTIDVHYQRLEKIGFKKVAIWQQQFNFCSIIAVK